MRFLDLMLHIEVWKSEQCTGFAPSNKYKESGCQNSKTITRKTRQKIIQQLQNDLDAETHWLKFWYGKKLPILRMHNQSAQPWDCASVHAISRLVCNVRILKTCNAILRLCKILVCAEHMYQIVWDRKVDWLLSVVLSRGTRWLCHYHSTETGLTDWLGWC